MSLLHKDIVSICFLQLSLVWFGTTICQAQSGLDPRSMGMGGVGVAIANPSTAPFFNPAVLAIEKRERFSIEVPTIGVRAYDPNDFLTKLSDFQDLDLVSALENSISDFNLAPSEASSGAVVGDINELNQNLANLDGSPLVTEIGIGLSLGDSGQEFGWTLYASGRGQIGTLFNYQDEAFFDGFAAAIDVVDFDNPANNTAAQLDALSDYVSYDLDPVTGEVLNVQSLPFAEDDINSSVDVLGLGQHEIGISMARNIGGVAYGITPKFVRSMVYDYSANAQVADYAVYDEDDFVTEYDNFNVDIGFARELDGGFTVGFVGKNLIEQRYEGFRRNPDTLELESTGNVVTTSAIYQVGMARQEQWGTFAIDYDLQEVKGFNGLPGSQFLSAGIELDAWGWGQLRTGYRMNLSDSDRSVLSAGVGLSPFGIHVDLAVAGNSNEVGAAAQLGFRF
ncbi:MAG: conjugal transfer protein TraF [Planctomycetota bacterium]